MENNKNRIIFRADGNSTIGIGHIMRLIGLFEILRDEFYGIFLVRRPDKLLKETIEKYCKVIVLNSTSLSDEIAELEFLLTKDDVVVLDGYDFDENYQKYIKSKAFRLIMIDDKADRHFYADLVINHGANFKDNYKCEPYSKILSGTDYLILRKEFLNSALIKRRINKVDSVLICMGGADPYNITIKALRASLICSFIQKIVVITGSSFSNKTKLEELIIKGSECKTIIYENNIDAVRIIELINTCELAICPSSTIALEICCVKAGLLTGTVIDNQQMIHNHLVGTNCCLSLQDFCKATHEIISSYLNEMNNIEFVNTLISNQSRIIDGYSGKRILQEIKMLCKCEN